MAKSLKLAIKNTVESFNFVVLIYLGKGFFLLIRGDVASWIRRFVGFQSQKENSIFYYLFSHGYVIPWMRQISISEGKLNLLQFVFVEM